MENQKISYRWWKTSGPLLTERETLPLPVKLIPAYNVTRGRYDIIWRHRKSSWQYNQWTPKTGQVGFTKLLLFPQRDQQVEARYEARNEETLRSPV